MDTARFDFRLPEELIAQSPPQARDGARLLVLNRTERCWQDRQVRELPALLRRGDLLVFNATRVIPARLRALRKKSGGKVEIFLLPPLPSEVNPPDARVTVRRALTRSGGRLLPGEELTLPEGLHARLVERLGEAGDVLEFAAPPAEFARYLEAHGEVPLPPYIKRPEGPSTPEDRARYQTIFAQTPGAVAAPTAGLHFTPELLAALAEKGIEHTRLTLHVGPGTFKPVKAAQIEDHNIDGEPYEISSEAALAVTTAKKAGRRVVAVGSTALRTLEFAWDEAAGVLQPGQGVTGLYIRPPHRFKVADALLTNFHLPKSSLLILAAAFAAPGSEEGIDFVRVAYAHAVANKYRFFSYGDACLFES